MIKTKRFFSAFMAITMIASMLTCLSTSANARYAHENDEWSTSWDRAFDPNEEYGIRSYAELAAEYGDNDVCSTNPWVYIGAEFYEYNDTTSTWELTDHYVQPNQKLKLRFYLKSNCYLGLFSIHMMFERSFFKLYSCYTGTAYTPRYSISGRPSADGFYNTSYPINIQDQSELGGSWNTNNPYTPMISYSKVNILPCSHLSLFTSADAGLDKAFYDSFDFIQSFPTFIDNATCVSGQTDEYLFDMQIQVRSTAETKYSKDGTSEIVNPVPNGTVGLAGYDETNTSLHNSSLIAYCYIAADGTVPKTKAKSFQVATAEESGIANAVTFSSFHTEDMNHTFIIGEPPASGFNAKFLDDDGTTEYTALAQSNTATVTLPSYTKDGYTLGGWIDTASNIAYNVGQEVTLTAGTDFKAVWNKNCSVDSINRVTVPYYAKGTAQYNITIAKDVKPEQVIIEYQREDGSTCNTAFRRTDYELGTELITNIAANADGCEVWTVNMALAATTEPTYKAYCTIDGVTESTATAYKFGVTYDEKEPEAISAEFLSAAISNTQAVRGSYLTWTVTTTANVEWLEFKFDYTTKSGTQQTASAYYKFSNYLYSKGNAVVTDVDGVRTWSIAMPFTYLGSDDYVDQSWTVNYRCLKDSKWYSGMVSDGNGGYAAFNPNVRVARSSAILDPAPVETLEKYSLVSAVADKAAPAVGDYVYFTVKTTSDVSKVRLSCNYTSGSATKTKRCTYQQTSSNVTGYDTTETGYITWTIRYRITTAASDNLFSVDCRGVSWGDAKTVTVAVA